LFFIVLLLPFLKHIFYFIADGLVTAGNIMAAHIKINPSLFLTLINFMVFSKKNYDDSTLLGVCMINPVGFYGLILYSKKCQRYYVL